MLPLRHESCRNCVRHWLTCSRSHTASSDLCYYCVHALSRHCRDAEQTSIRAGARITRLDERL